MGRERSSAPVASAGTRLRLQSVAIELTARCNLRCGHCYNDFRADDGASLVAVGGDLLLARVDKLLDAVDVDHVTLTGGEPFVTEVLWPLLERLAKRGVAAQIISNGTLINAEVAVRLAQLGPRFVQITLDGSTAAGHDAHVGEGSFELALRGIRALGEVGVPVVGCVVVTRDNATSVGAILALWKQLGVRQVALSRFSPAGYAVEQAAHLLPTRSDLMQAFEQAASHARQEGTLVSCTMPVPPCMLETGDYAPLRFGHCAIGTSMQEVAMGPDGKLRNCTLHRAAIGGVSDILVEGVDVAALLRHRDVSSYRRALPAFCQGCLHADSCGGGCGAAAEWMLGLAGQRRLPDPVLWQHIDDRFKARLASERASQRGREKGEGTREEGRAKRRLDLLS